MTVATVGGVMRWLDELDQDAELWVITRDEKGVADKRRITGGLITPEKTNGETMLIALATEPYFKVPDEFA